MIILGINAYHGDVAAALLRDGELVAAVEEERFRRIKHWAGFPREAIRTCLEMAKIAPAFHSKATLAPALFHTVVEPRPVSTRIISSKRWCCGVSFLPGAISQT